MLELMFLRLDLVQPRRHRPFQFFFFFFNDTATTEIYTLSLHDALPISALSPARRARRPRSPPDRRAAVRDRAFGNRDRKSTRLNSSHSQISYAVFCLKKKKNKNNTNMLSATNADHSATDREQPSIVDGY